MATLRWLKRRSTVAAPPATTVVNPRSWLGHFASTGLRSIDYVLANGGPRGPDHVTRQGASLMRTVGLDDWVAPHARSFADTVLARVVDLPQLAELRAALRERARASPLFDAPRFAGRLAQALHGIASSDEPNAVFDGGSQRQP